MYQHGDPNTNELIATESALEAERVRTHALEQQLRALEQQLLRATKSSTSLPPKTSGISRTRSNITPPTSTTTSSTTIKQPRRPFVTSASLGSQSKHYGGIYQTNGTAKMNELNEEWRRNNRLRALNLAETNLHTSGRSLSSLQQDMTREIELFTHSIDTRQAQINRSHATSKRVQKAMLHIQQEVFELQEMMKTNSHLFSTEHEAHASFLTLSTQVDTVMNKLPQTKPTLKRMGRDKVMEEEEEEKEEVGSRK